MLFSRVFAMPNSDTFSLPPVAALLDRWGIPAGGALIVDPFARNSDRATLTNDLNPATSAQFHMEAADFLDMLIEENVQAGIVLFDPPYSPRQIAECYQQVGKHCGTRDTQNARLYKVVKDKLDAILRLGGFAVCCGWNSMGMGLNRGYELREVLLVPHGAAHNDTIVTVEIKKVSTG